MSSHLYNIENNFIKKAILLLVIYILLTPLSMFIAHIFLRVEIHVINGYKMIYGTLQVTYIILICKWLKQPIKSQLKPKVNKQFWASISIGIISAFLLRPFFQVDKYLEFFQNGSTLPYVSKVAIFSSNTVFYLIFVCIIGPFFEEFFYRKILLFNLIKKYNKWLMIIIVSVVFSLIHYSIVGLIPYFLFSIIVSVIFLRTQNLFYPIVIHSISNLFTFTISYFSSIKPELFYSTTFYIVYLTCITSLWFFIKAFKRDDAN